MNTPDLRRHHERQARASRKRSYDPDVKRPAASEQRRKKAAVSAESPHSLASLLHSVPWWTLLLAAALLCLVAVQLHLISRGVEHRRVLAQEAEELLEQRNAMEEQIREIEVAAPVSCEIRYLVPGQADIVEQVPYGATALLHEPVELDGYTFLNWLAPDGNPETRSSFSVYEDLVLTAHYALPLETEEHIPYLTADKNGVVDVDAVVTIREFVQVLYRLLNIDLVGQGEFLDVVKKDPCFKAAATLKELGVLTGNYLYPDDPLRFLDLLQLLERFYPASDEVISFPRLNLSKEEQAIYATAASYGWIDSHLETVPSDTVTRGELAHVVNRVLGRATQSHPPESRVGTILDVGPANPHYADIAEAVIPHEYTWNNGVEVWTDSSPLPAHDPGLFFAGVRLHCITGSGRHLRNTRADGRRYNANGEVTTGDAELDRALWTILEETVDPVHMDSEEMLRLVYDYVCDNYAPCSGPVYEVGAEGWAIQEAWKILQSGEGSCYGYAALFYELSYMIGYQPVLISGSIYGEQTVFKTEDGTRVVSHPGYMPYAWVEISFDGISYLFDPAGESRVDSYRNYYKRNNPVRWQRGYRSDVF